LLKKCHDASLLCEFVMSPSVHGNNLPLLRHKIARLSVRADMRYRVVFCQPIFGAMADLEAARSPNP